MNILGINGLFVTPASCLLQDGKLIAMAEEERFNRLKGSFGVLPEKATQFCLNYAGLTLDDIDYIAFPHDAYKYRFYMPYFLFSAYLRRGPKNPQFASSLTSAALEELIKYRPENLKGAIIAMLRKAGLRGRIPPIEFIPHHLAHAACAFYSSGFPKAHILVVDGHGEDKCTSIFKGEGLEIKEEKSFKIPDSLGWFYQSITEFLGFLPNKDEGKTMALASYGRYNEEIYTKFKKMISFDANGSYKYDAGYSLLGKHNYGTIFSDRMVELFTSVRYAQEELQEIHKDIAYAAQDILEKISLAIVKDLSYSPDYNKKLCIAGGVGLNCKMNGAIAKQDYIDEIFIPPVSSDAGAPLGAALYLSKQKGYNPKFKMESAYWGPKFTNSQIRQSLDRFGVKFKEDHKIEATVAELLSKDKIVGWFQGRMEIGPRALGARSILANPKKALMKDFVNKVKNREPWRPFAPSILDEKKGEYLTKPKYSPFMAMAFEAVEKTKDKIPAVIHVDNTTRPHCVKKEINPRYWQLIAEFEKLTGIPLILNTSFNGRGEPIVCRPEEALRTFYTTDMDYLALGDFLVSR